MDHFISDARLWHPWLRINRVRRVRLHTRWSAEAWARRHMKLQADPYFVVHILRHTCASRLLQGGADLEYVRRWLGHKDIKMTQRYVVEGGKQ
jgi:integrase